MKYYFIYNPIAGQKEKGEKFLEDFSKLKQNPNLDLHLYYTNSVGDATNYAEKIAKDHKEEDICIFAVGGDGTMNEVINGIANYKNVIFGIIPTGSCNDFLKIYGDHDFLNLEKQINGKIIPTDLLKVEDFYCLNVTNIGFDARVNFDQITYRPQFKTIKGAYNYAIFRNIIKPLGDRVIVKVDDKVFYSGKTTLMALGNGGFYGGGYNCAPLAKTDDGLIDITIIKKISVFRLITLIGKYKKGLIFNNPKYKKIAFCTTAKKIEIESPEVLTVCIDGETIHRNHLLIENLKHKIRFILPN